MNQLKHGGPAFPCAQKDKHVTDHNGVERVIPEIQYPGMSMRDWFATHCPDSEIPTIDLVKRLDRFGQEAHTTKVHRQEQIIRCEARYIYADAMLAARAS
jgi:hypothetical protein